MIKIHARDSVEDSIYKKNKKRLMMRKKASKRKRRFKRKPIPKKLSERFRIENALEIAKNSLKN